MRVSIQSAATNMPTFAIVLVLTATVYFRTFMVSAVAIRPVSEANCPLRRAIMVEPDAQQNRHFALQMGVMVVALALVTALTLENLPLLSYIWQLIMELCS